MIEIDVKKQYDSTMDSVNLINGPKPADWSDEEWTLCLQRNIDHIKIMLAKDFWTDNEDLTPFQDAIIEQPKK